MFLEIFNIKRDYDDIFLFCHKEIVIKEERDSRGFYSYMNQYIVTCSDKRADMHVAPIAFLTRSFIRVSSLSGS